MATSKDISVSTTRTVPWHPVGKGPIDTSSARLARAKSGPRVWGLRLRHSENAQGPQNAPQLFFLHRWDATKGLWQPHRVQADPPQALNPSESKMAVVGTSRLPRPKIGRSGVEETQACGGSWPHFVLKKSLFRRKLKQPGICL